VGKTRTLRILALSKGRAGFDTRPRRIKRIMPELYRVLRAGGRIVTQDFFTSEHHTSPVMAALCALNMLVGTPRDRTYSEIDVRHWSEAAGFHGIHRPGVPVPAGIPVATR